MVTGGAGFIGGHLCAGLVERGDETLCVDNLDPYYNPEIKRDNLRSCLERANFHFFERNIRDHKDLQKLFEEFEVEKIVHLAARAGVRASIENPRLYQKVNIGGTLNLLELARRHDIKNFVFGSSSSVYGANENVPFREDGSTLPISPYGASKRAAELYCQTYSKLYGLKVSALRFFTVYGPRQRPDMAIHKFTRLINQGEEVPMFGNGNSKRDYTYIDDVIEGILSALDKSFEFETFNLGNSRTVGLKDLISLIEETLGKRARIRQLPPQTGDVLITYADISKAKELLDYEPKTFIEEGIQKFVGWFRNQDSNKIIVENSQAQSKIASL